MRTDSETDPSLDYVQRVNRAIDHVLAHLDQPLSLEVVARAASFSPFHFHRVFKSLTGETLNAFIKRVRLERAVSMLGRTQGRSLTEIALACGFGSSSDFSRSFKQRFGVPPSAFDVQAYRRDRRERWQSTVADPEYRHLLQRLPPGENPDGFEVELLRLPPRRVAYIRVPDPFSSLGAVTGAAERLVEWAEARGVAGGTWYGYMWDDPEVVAHEDCRYDVAVEVDEVRPEGEVGRFDFPAMTVAKLEIKGAIDLEQRALDWIYATWLPRSGMVPTDQPCFEVWHGRPFAHGYEHFELDLHLPIRSLLAVGTDRG
ncbi:AraC family transcriptional regulator [Engelhardtia mirabilis]|uniref:Right origin-binding protein n=1 Tax=Engelhardtia mirabilis TaxID=2528011 RepID=A0A518BDW3_9BACT|nr:Right origin-binding protein [Planctomycetes bacterium Pla133]QDU99500.1 Right origin-binding protein [Planctomycetes bacterium Pla86]